MEKQKKIGINVMGIILGIFLVSAFVFFILAETFLPAENVSKDGACKVLDAEWERILSDGKMEQVKVPGQCEVKRGEWLSITTTLPNEQSSTWCCIRSLQQDIRIYVDDELREEYSTIDSQLFGKTSTIAYVFFPIYVEDAGKELRIELMSDSAYSGFVDEIYTGEKAEIWKHFLKLYAPSTFMAVFLLVMSVGVVFGSLVVRILYKRNVEIVYLGMVLLIASAWLIAESRLRQFILPNSTIAVYLGFFMIMLLPYPFSVYMNVVQKGRYEKAYFAILAATVINCILATSLQISGVKDFFETMGISHVIIVSLIVVLTATIITDVRKGYVREYREVAIGMACMMVAGVMEIAMVYISSSRYNGISLCLGLVLLLFMAALKTIRDIFNVEKEHQVAIAASESQAKFLANVSHEIRTPINTVIGMNEMILRENHNDNIQDYANNIHSASKMLLGLINDLLDLSKIEAGKLQITEQDYQLASMLNDVILGIKVRAQQKKLTMIVHIDETMPAVLNGDEIRIKQILNNLLSNAVKYTETGSVTFSVKGVQTETGFALQVAVEDTGMGISEEDMEHLFESFHRLELKKNRHIEGTGLGLSITKQLVENMGGWIKVSSEHGKGSCFTVQIPQKIVEQVCMGSLEQKYRADSVKKGNQLHAPHAKVLVVDDNPMNLKVIEALLKRTEIQLDLATSGKECLQMTRVKKYDLILMDHMMPEPDGVQTLHMLREEQGNVNHETPVIVLTANAIEGVEKQYKEEGFADYLSKPVEPEKMERMLEKYLRDVGDLDEDIRVRSCQREDIQVKNSQSEDGHQEYSLINEKQETSSQEVEEQASLKSDDMDSEIFEIDHKLGVLYSGGSEEAYQQVLALYREQGEEYLQQLPEAFEKKDWENFKIIVHAIKSTSLTIGAKIFSEKAKKLEKATKDGDIDYVVAQWEKFIKEYEALLDYVKEAG